MGKSSLRTTHTKVHLISHSTLVRIVCPLSSMERNSTWELTINHLSTCTTSVCKSNISEQTMTWTSTRSHTEKSQVTVDPRSRARGLEEKTMMRNWGKLSSCPSKKLKWKKQLLNPRRLPRRKRGTGNPKRAKAGVTPETRMTLTLG